MPLLVVTLAGPTAGGQWGRGLCCAVVLGQLVGSPWGSSGCCCSASICKQTTPGTAAMPALEKKRRRGCRYHQLLGVMRYQGRSVQQQLPAVGTCSVAVCMHAMLLQLTLLLAHPLAHLA
jgi:hypothetical protein